VPPVSNVAAPAEPTLIRRVFPHWSITIPAPFEETFVDEDGYWHAWYDRRSVSLTSLVIRDDRNRPVPSRRILERFPAGPGSRVEMPPGLDGWAVNAPREQPAQALQAVSGLVAVDGGVLIATVTAEELAWATGVWRSIRRS
jgi:hypothetical protein